MELVKLALKGLKTIYRNDLRYKKAGVMVSAQTMFKKACLIVLI